MTAGGIEPATTLPVTVGVAPVNGTPGRGASGTTGEAPIPELAEILGRGAAAAGLGLRLKDGRPLNEGDAAGEAAARGAGELILGLGAGAANLATEPPDCEREKDALELRLTLDDPRE